MVLNLYNNENIAGLVDSIGRGLDQIKGAGFDAVVMRAHTARATNTPWWFMILTGSVSFGSSKAKAGKPWTVSSMRPSMRFARNNGEMLLRISEKLSKGFAGCSSCIPPIAPKRTLVSSTPFARAIGGYIEPGC